MYVKNPFQVYAFVMIGCNIPTTVFTLLQLLLSKDLPLINFLLTIPTLMICIFQLTSLTFIPAMLHIGVSESYRFPCKTPLFQLERSKHHFYSNMRVWKNFDRNIYQVASSLASHLSQSDLGVSIWGFAVVSKPLILTVTFDFTEASFPRKPDISKIKQTQCFFF